MTSRRLELDENKFFEVLCCKWFVRVFGVDPGRSNPEISDLFLICL